MGAFSDFAAKHWIVGGIVASLLWFIAGKQSLSHRNINPALGWQVVGVMIVLIMCGWTVVGKEWLGFGAGIAVAYFEVRSIRRSTLKTGLQ